MNTQQHRMVLAAVCVCFTCTAAADMSARADAHAPIGVMGDHFHDAGGVMLSYRYMTMSMQGNRDGTDGISVGEIATTVPNRFFGRPGQPPTLRVVPTDMTMEMHMLGAMYAPSDWLTLMAMVQHVSKEMTHTTFQGPLGNTVLGRFRTETSGLGDATVAGLFRLVDGDGDGGRWHATLGVSVPTGDTEKTDTILTPMGGTPKPRLPYPMQLGSGSLDPIVGLTWASAPGAVTGGAQWRSTFRIEDNDEDYRLGDEHELTGWLAYGPSDAWSFSARLRVVQRDDIDGIDPAVVAPVQTADPDRQGLTRVDAGVGVNWIGHGHRLALEVMAPVYEDLDGPQLETDYTVTVGYQFAF